MLVRKIFVAAEGFSEGKCIKWGFCEFRRMFVGLFFLHNHDPNFVRFFFLHSLILLMNIFFYTKCSSSDLWSNDTSLSSSSPSVGLRRLYALSKFCKQIGQCSRYWFHSSKQGRWNPKYFFNPHFYLKATRHPNNFFHKLYSSDTLKWTGVSISVTHGYTFENSIVHTLCKKMKVFFCFLTMINIFSTHIFIWKRLVIQIIFSTNFTQVIL